jgi:hypothetical protein
LRGILELFGPDADQTDGHGPGTDRIEELDSDGVDQLCAVDRCVDRPAAGDGGEIGVPKLQ